MSFETKITPQKIFGSLFLSTVSSHEQTNMRFQALSAVVFLQLLTKSVLNARWVAVKNLTFTTTESCYFADLQIAFFTEDLEDRFRNPNTCLHRFWPLRQPSPSYAIILIFFSKNTPMGSLRIGEVSGLKKDINDGFF